MKAVILDMDGVIVDSEHRWKVVEKPFFKELLGSWTEEDGKHIVGFNVVDIYTRLKEKHGLTLTRADFVERCGELAKEVYGRQAKLLDGLTGFLNDMKAHGVRMGLASSSPRTWIDIVLKRFELAPLFEATVAGDEVDGKTKPQPEPYLRAARLLNLAPSDCVAVEDSSVGIKAAKGAGMACVGFRSEDNEGQDLSAADFEAKGFAALDYQSLIARLKSA